MHSRIEKLEFQININCTDWQGAGEVIRRSRRIELLDGEVFMTTGLGVMWRVIA